MLGAIEVTHERAETALVLHHLLLTISVPLIDEDNAYTGIQKRKLTEPVLQRFIAEFRYALEGIGARQEGDLGAATALRIADDAQRSLRHAVHEADKVLFSVSPNGELKPRGQGVDDRNTDAVQTA